MAIKDDFAVTRANGNVRAVAGTANYTVLELHRYLQDLSDDASSVGDDERDITDLDNISRRSFDTIINLLSGYNIDDATSQRLFGGSITQDDGATRYSGLQIAGSFPTAGAEQTSPFPEVIQDNVKLTAFWNAASTFNPDTVLGFSHQFLVKTREDNVNIDGGRVRVISRGYGFAYREASTTLGVGNGVAAVGAIAPDAFNTVTATNVVLAPFTSVTNDVTGQIGSIDLNNGNGAQPYYAEWNPNSTDLSGLYNRVKWLTRVGETTDLLGGYGIDGELFRGITHEIDYVSEAGGNPTIGDQYVWGLEFGYTGTGGFTIGEVVEIGAGPDALGRVLAEDTTGDTLVVAIESGTVSNGDAVATPAGGSGATATINTVPAGQTTGGGRGQILSADDSGTTGRIFIQLLAGTVPADATVLYDSTDQGKVLTVNTAGVTEQALPLNSAIGDFFGTLLGGFGVGVVAGLSVSDQLIDLNGVTQSPPNNVQVRVLDIEGGVAEQDRVILGRRVLGALQTDRYSANGAQGALATTFVVNEVIDADDPPAGTVRVFDAAANSFRRVPYDSITAPSTFNLSGTLGAAISANADAFVPILDGLGSGGTQGQEDGSIQNTLVYQGSPIDIIGIVRNGGANPIQEFPISGQVDANGFSVSAVRTPDA